MSGTKLQVLSDLHTELLKYSEKLPDIPVVSDTLILAGDIGDPFKKSFEEYIEEVSKKYKLVLLVIGNHEFYGHEIEETKIRTSKICDSFVNVFFLDKKSYQLKKGLKIIGCTLWSEIPEEAEDEVLGSMSDYMLIRVKKEGNNSEEFRRLDVKDTKKFFADELDFIERELKNSKRIGEKVVVVTHHAPLFRGVSDPVWEGSEVNHAFQSDLSKLIKKPVVAWISGHTHFSYQLKHRGIPVVSNQLGYVKEKGKCGFKENYFLEI